MPFLTSLDSRAAIKGSRDPLGLVPVWSRFGRVVVGNLTTVSNSVRGFATLLLGLYFAETIRESGSSSEESALELFLKFEQLAGYARWHHRQDDDFRGRDRVVARLLVRPKVTLGADPLHQILSNQRIYGLWGLFSVPARESGLRSDEQPILTPAAKDFVEQQYISRLKAEGLKGGAPIMDLLRRKNPEVHLGGRDSRPTEALARLLSARMSLKERVFYKTHLVEGGPKDRTNGLQPALSSLLAELPGDTKFDMHELTAMIRRTRRMPDGERLSEALESIKKLEQLLVPLENAFLFVLTRERQLLSSVADEIKHNWAQSLAYIDVDVISQNRSKIDGAFGDSAATNRFLSIGNALKAGQYHEAIKLLIDHNAFIMRARGAAGPWVEVTRGKIGIRYRDESGELIARKELPNRWRNTYFINSLKDVVVTLTAGNG
jgi:hypothetical protein